MPVKYDERVKAPHEEYHYTMEEIEELKKCSHSIHEFIKYVKIIHPDRGEISFAPTIYDYQNRMLGLFQDNRFVISLCSRQSGKTTIVGIYALWYAMFFADKMIGIVSNKESSAKMILARIKRMYESLPVWMKPGVKSYNMTSVEFDNGTSILVSATSTDAFRGNTMNLLICDEFAFVKKNQADDFWASNYPTVAASKEARIIIISTPNGLFNKFHEIYSKAEIGQNTFKHMKVSWNEVPGRDEEWAKDQLKNLGPQKFNQEFAVEFLGSTNTVIDPVTLSTLISKVKDPEFLQLEDKLNVYEKPQKDCKYVIGVDVAKGTGEHYSCSQILKINSIHPVDFEQVAVFFDNKTDVYKYAEVINRMALYYNNANIIVENNAEGSTIVTELWWRHENSNLVNSGSKTTDLGIRATSKTKTRAVLLMKRLIEDGSVKIVDKETIDELVSFIEENNKFFGKDKPDDAISALYWALYILEMNVLDDEFTIKKSIENDDVWGVLADYENIEEDWSWMDDFEPRG